MVDESGNPSHHRLFVIELPKKNHRGKNEDSPAEKVKKATNFHAAVPIMFSRRDGAW